MNAPPPSSDDPAELPAPPASGGREFAPVGERASSVKSAAPVVASHDEDLPFPLPADWFERKHAAAKAKAEAAAAAAAVAEAEAKAKAEAESPAGPAGQGVVRQRPNAEMLRAVAVASSGEDRNKAFQANQRKGDDAHARGAWLEAASAYEVAARKAATPEQATQLAAKAVAARTLAERPRRQLTAALIVAALCGLGAGGWWIMQRRAAEAAAGPPPRPPAHLLSDDHGAGSGSLGERAKANAVLYDLGADVKQGERPWSAMLIAAKAALALPGVNHDEAQALVTRIAGEIAALDRDAAAIEALRVSEPARALALAAAFRAAHQRADDYIARLPLPGRLLLVDCPPACSATLDGAAIDAQAAAGDAGLVFCRSAQRARTVVAGAPGYISASLEIPADSALIERRSQITLEEKPLWLLAAPASAPPWVALDQVGGLALVATPQLLQAISLADGRPPAAALPAGGASGGLAAGAWTWNALFADGAAGWLASTSSGALCRVAVGADGLRAELLARSDHPPATAAMVELVLHLNAKALYTGATPWSPGPRPSARPRMRSPSCSASARCA